MTHIQSQNCKDTNRSRKWQGHKYINITIPVQFKVNNLYKSAAKLHGDFLYNSLRKRILYAISSTKMLKNILQLNVYYFFLQTFVKLLDEIINILDTSVMNVFLESSVFFANIRPSNVQKEFIFFLLFSVYLVLWWWIVETLWDRR